MMRCWTAFVIVFAACAALPSVVRGQATDRHASAATRKGRLFPNQPNPVTTETLIPFRVGDDTCSVESETHHVSLRIYNILSQIVAVPVLLDSAAGVDATSTARTDTSVARAAPAPVTNLELACGSYVARWNGRHDADDRRASAGVYMLQLMIDGKSAGMRRMVVTR